MLLKEGNMKQMVENLLVACVSMFAVVAVCTLVFSFGFVEFGVGNPQLAEASAEGK